MWDKSERLKALPPYLFLEIDKAKRDALAMGRDVINLGVGDPDRPTFDFIIKRLKKAADEPSNHRYPFDEGVPQFRQAAANFMKSRYGVDADPVGEVITTIGSKDGIAHLPLAVVDPGQVVLVPRPGYPVYNSASIFAGARTNYLPLSEQNGWLVDLESIPQEVARQARLIYVNYPNNPTASTASDQWCAELVSWAKENEVIVASDAAYNEVYFDDDNRPPSILQAPGGKDVSVEFHSLSKTFNMTGWRLGFAVGNADIIAALAQVKGNVDSGQFNAIQWAGAEALENYDSDEVVEQREIYHRRRDILCDGLQQGGYRVSRPAATFYVWGACPDGVDSMTFARRCLDEADVVLIPGAGFGEPAEGYFRASLTVPEKRLTEAVERLGKIKW